MNKKAFSVPCYMEKAIEFILSKFPSVKDKLDLHMLEMISDAIVALSLKVLGAVLTFLFNLLLARSLGAEGAGLYFLALTVTTIATVFGRVGLDNTLLRFVASYAAVGKWDAVKGVYVKGIIMVLIASFVSALTVFFLAPVIAEKVFEKSALIVPMRWMAIAVVPSSLLIMYAQMLKGIKYIKESFIVYGISVPALLLVGIYVLKDTYGVIGVTWLYCIATVIAGFIGLYFWVFATPMLKNVKSSFKTKELLNSSVPLFWVALLSVFIESISPLVLGVWRDESDVGVFWMALRVAMLAELVFMPINSIVAPKFAALYKKKEKVALALLAKNSAKLMTVFASPLLFVFFVFPKYIMGVFGAGFDEGWIALSILGVGQFMNIVTGPSAYLLIMSGNENIVRNNSLFVAIVSLFINITLIPYMGLIGAALSVSICVSLKNVIAVYFVWLKLKICVVPLVCDGLVYLKKI